MEQFNRITTDITRMNGEPCIRDLRLTVRRVLEALATYPDRAELIMGSRLRAVLLRPCRQRCAARSPRLGCPA